MTTSPNFTGTPKNGLVQATVANTARDGTGTLVTVFTAGASGSLIECLLLCTPVAAAVQNVLRLFVHDGTNARLIKEIQIGANNASLGDSVYQDIVQMNLVLATGYSLRAAIDQASTLNIFAQGGDF
jgi:hypothetical protein